MKRDKAGKIVGFGGFGNMNAYPARLVLQSVSDVTPKEIDYSKADAVTKDEPQTFSGTGRACYDPLDGCASKLVDAPWRSACGRTGQRRMLQFSASRASTTE